MYKADSIPQTTNQNSDFLSVSDEESDPEFSSRLHRFDLDLNIGDSIKFSGTKGNEPSTTQTKDKI